MAITVDGENNRASVLMLNRDLDSPCGAVLDRDTHANGKVLACETINGKDLKAKNTFAEPKKVLPQPFHVPKAGSKMTFKLPPASYSVAQPARSGI